MAILGDEIWLEFHGGLHTSLHPAKIGESELSDGENFIGRDGTLRLDQRYILAAERRTADYEQVQGSGYGKYGDYEQYVMVLDRGLRMVDLTQEPLTMREVRQPPVAEGLGNGDWFFEQFEQYIYGVGAAVDETAKGIGRKLIAPGEDGTGDWDIIRRPKGGTTKPNISIYQPAYSSMSFSGATLTPSSGSITATAVGDNIKVTTTAAGEHTLTITLDTSPDLSFDSEYRDIWEVRIVRSLQSLGVPELTITQDGVSYDLRFWYGFIQNFGTYRHIGVWRLQSIPRSARDGITSITFTFNAPDAGTYVWTISPPKGFGVWMSVPTTYDPGEGFPSFNALKYAVTYVNQVTGLESPPSPVATIPAYYQPPNGLWVNVSFPASAEDGVSHIRVYRVVGDEGEETYYQLTELANVAATYVDKLAVDEIEGNDIYIPSVLPTAGITAIASWQRRLWLGVGNLVYGSRFDDELSFVDLTGPLDANDPGNAITFNCDDRKSEKIYGLGAGDALTVVTDRSVRALFGTAPQNWRYVRLPCSEGAVGPRAWCNYQQGVLVLTPSGRLLYIALGMSEPVDIGRNVRSRPGNDGIAEMATADAVVGLRPDGQIEVRNQAGRYFVFDPASGIRKGTHTHPTHSLLFVSGQPVRWLGMNGKLYEGGSDDYVSDGGTTGTNGEPVEWWAETREYSLPRNSVDSVYWGASTESIQQPGNKVLAPRILIYQVEGNQEYTKEFGKLYNRPTIKLSGERLKARISGDRYSNVTECRLGLNPLSKAVHR